MDKKREESDEDDDCRPSRRVSAVASAAQVRALRQHWILPYVDPSPSMWPTTSAQCALSDGSVLPSRTPASCICEHYGREEVHIFGGNLKGDCPRAASSGRRTATMRSPPREAITKVLTCTGSSRRASSRLRSRPSPTAGIGAGFRGIGFNLRGPSCGVGRGERRVARASDGRSRGRAATSPRSAWSSRRRGGERSGAVGR